jgi:hypothetical protein
MASLRLLDFRDADLMAKLAREGGADGLTSREFALALGMKEDDAQSVAVRASWMRHFGAFEFDGERKLWRLTEAGDEIVEANQRSRSIAPVDDAPKEKLIDVMAHLTARMRAEDELTSHLLRREFVYGTTRGSAAWRTNGRRPK